jgi:hypothetical protein
VAFLLEKNVMEWREVPNLKGYFINQEGKVRGPSGSFLKTKINRNGYLSFSKTIHFRIHRIMMESFDPNNRNQLVRHLDGDKLNNNLKNLKWGTYSENALDAFKHGHRKPKRGTQSKHSKLTESDIIEIRERSKKESKKVIAVDYPVSYGTVCKIARGEDWAHI